MASPTISWAPNSGVTATSTTQSFDTYSARVTATYNLTTTFTPPASCFAPTYTVSPRGNDTVVAYGAARRGYSPECFPIGFGDIAKVERWQGANQLIVQEIQFGNLASTVNKRQEGDSSRRTIERPQSWYSPGVCPSGYVAAAATYDGQTYFNTCCPSSMSVIETSCTSAADTVTFINGTDTWLQTVQSALAPSIVVAYESSDLSLWATPESTSTTSAASTSRPTETGILPTAAPEPGPGLSTGAKAGIGSGVAGVVIVGFVILGLVIRKRRTGRNGDPSSYNGKAELAGDGVHRELTGEGAMYEKSSVVKPVEIDNDSPAELDGDWRGWEIGTPQRHLTVSERNI
ncbi:hypothetical protein CKM354_000914500 [Cercospora kikuchii]|uniref:Uncharacterized protein n=1 Tax=Cercospora kikuchii TaxID=84275 RepID=A0A9P3CML6_9PEZI|nr:uncharacterized protein CKM354_000914500 [Cercospora kikuchii]GIZ46002.1 hypothetical protein CKM354_000914500 [Cercospora kikuchii]